MQNLFYDNAYQHLNVFFKRFNLYLMHFVGKNCVNESAVIQL